MTSLNPQKVHIPRTILAEVERLEAEWESRQSMQRLWRGDDSLWTSSGESSWLGWLSVIDRQLASVEALKNFARSVSGRFSHAVLLGMGGSSLCPEVLSHCFPKGHGFPQLRVVDSTDPDQIRECEASIRPESTIFISASKSGSTLETALLTDYFFEHLSSIVGFRRAAARFVAITDPGSRLESRAREAGFGYLLHGEPEIGGRYSALSNFGMVPAAAMGLDTEKLLTAAHAMQSACGPKHPPAQNPGLRLGLLLGAAAMLGRDKLTILASPGVSSLGVWIEQLIAESTGKRGRGIVPVEGEALVSPEVYGNDRLFAILSLTGEMQPSTEAMLDELESLGHPVVRIGIRSLGHIGQEFFRWEVATAVAGAVMGIDPFDQPDVESAKVAARELTDAFEAQGSLPYEDPVVEENGIQLFAGPRHAECLLDDAGERGVPAVLRAHLESVRDGDYVALLAFINRNPDSVAALDRLRGLVRSRSPVATCVGFGPRFLHSTGQLHKGGANTGVFLQIGCDPNVDLHVPDRKLTFGVVKHAQALGDCQVLERLGRRVLRVHLDGPVRAGLVRLEAALLQAVQ